MAGRRLEELAFGQHHCFCAISIAASASGSRLQEPLSRKRHGELMSGVQSHSKQMVPALRMTCQELCEKLTSATCYDCGYDHDQQYVVHQHQRKSR